MFKLGDIIKDKDINKCAIIVNIEYMEYSNEYRYHLKWLDQDSVESFYSPYLMDLCMVKVNE